MPTNGSEHLLLVTRLTRSIGLAAFLAVASLLGGCRGTLERDVGTSLSERTYTALYPYYAELCAASQFRKRPNTGIEIEGGGFGGHSVLYLNGVCRARDAHYPELRMCEGPDAAEKGVGLSINAHYKNANWVATEGRDFVFHGLLATGEPLTRQSYDQTVAHAEAMGILDGVEFHQSALEEKPEGMDLRDFRYQVSLGTDYALNYARDRYCARVPLSRDQMEKVVDYLNDVNAVYKSGQKDFRWNVFQDNCSHLIRNALAAADVWRPWPIDRFIVYAVLSFPVPKNEFVNLMRRTNDAPISDVWALYNDPVARNALMRDDRLPTEPGALAQLERIAQPNDIYEGNIRLVFYDDPLSGRYQRRFDRILSEKRYTDIRANLSYFADLYRRIEAEQKPLEWYLARHPRVAQSEKAAFSAFYERYYDYVKRQRAAIERHSDVLRAMRERSQLTRATGELRR